MCREGILSPGRDSGQYKRFSAMIRLNCFIRVPEENRDMVLAAAFALTSHSLTEKGCIAYDVFASGTRPDVLMICETWADQESLDAHSASEAFKKYVGEMRNLSEMKLERFEF